MKAKSRFSRNICAISDRIWCNKHLRHTTTQNMRTLMVIITIQVQGPNSRTIFSIVIQIRWKIGFSVTALHGVLSLQNFTHVTTTQLPRHVQHFVAITSLQLGWDLNECPSNLNSDGKIIREMGPGPVCIRHFVITLPAHAVPPHCARCVLGTWVTIFFYTFRSQFYWKSMILFNFIGLDKRFDKGRRDLAKSRGTSSVNPPKPPSNTRVHEF